MLFLTSRRDLPGRAHVNDRARTEQAVAAVPLRDLRERAPSTPFRLGRVK